MNPVVRHIQETVAEHFRLPPGVMQWPWSGSREMSLPRHVAMYLARRICRQRQGAGYPLRPLSYPQIGQMFGGRDHSTVIYAIRKVEKMIASDNDFAAKVLELEQIVGRSASLERAMARIDDPAVRKIVILSKWQRGELSGFEAERLIRRLGLVNA